MVNLRVDRKKKPQKMNFLNLLAAFFLLFCDKESFFFHVLKVKYSILRFGRIEDKTLGQ